MLLAWCGCGAAVAVGVAAGVAAGVAIVQDKSKINFALQNEGLNICLLNYFAPKVECPAHEFTDVRLFFIFVVCIAYHSFFFL